MNTTDRSPNFLQKERKQTDSCLDLERGKADESFETYQKMARNETDKALKSGRGDSDRAREKSRSDADKRRAVAALPVSDKRFEPIDHALAAERRDEDHAIQTERTITDRVIEKERGLKDKATAQLLDHERRATDKSLSRERSRTDAGFERSAQYLAEERTAHLVTRAAVTTRDEFLAIVSHDLRSPLAAISSCADMLLDESFSPSIGDEVREWIRFIKRNADSSTRLISDILDIERIAEGKLHLNMGRYQLKDIIREAVEILSHVASAKTILLRALPSSAPTEIECDRDRILQVLSNLIGNALKFTPEGGTVLIKTEDSKDRWTVSVCDNGPGIPEEMKSSIFERFAQIHNTDRRGLGLGLYISKMVIEAHRGNIWVTSASGRGSTFFFTLPKQGSKSQSTH